MTTQESAADEGTPVPGGARPPIDLLARIGAWVLGVVSGVVMATAWLFLARLPFFLSAETQAAPVEAARRSIVAGLAVGLVLISVQMFRIVTSQRTRLPSSCAMALVTALITGLLKYVSPSDALALLWTMAGAVIVTFSVLHVFVWVTRTAAAWLLRVALDGRVARALSAASLLVFTPFCAVPVVTDEVAQLSEPADSIDEADLERALLLASTESFHPEGYECLQQVAAWRAEALRVAQRVGQLSRPDAEDVVGKVQLAVCVPPKAKDQLRPYFFKAVQNGAKDPRRERARHPECPLCPTLEAPEPPPDLACEERWAKAAVEELEEDLRKVVRLHVFEGYSLADVAAKVGIGKSTAHRRYELAIHHLQVRARTCVPHRPNPGSELRLDPWDERRPPAWRR